MTWKAWGAVAILAGALGLAGSDARAELPPGSYDKLRAKAEEALIIEVDSVKTHEREPGWLDVVVTARVVRVERSKARLKKGGTVTVRYESLDRTKLKKPVIGPRAVPLLKKGEFYPAFLNVTKETKEYQPAAYGESFVMTPEG